MTHNQQHNPSDVFHIYLRKERPEAETNRQFLVAIVFVTIVMSIGGVFGVMNTMFASIAARIKEVGVLRILGFKRWQILISFMLESLTIAFVGYDSTLGHFTTILARPPKTKGTTVTLTGPYEYVRAYVTNAGAAK